MHINISQGNLMDAIATVIRAVPSRPSHPVLTSILFVADKEAQRVTLTAFNLGLGIRITIDAEILSEGTFAFPGVLLQNIISRIPDCELEIEVNEKAATICCGCGSYEIKGLDFSEYPHFPGLGADDRTTIVVPRDLLVTGFKNTIFAASPNEAKQVLAGVNLKIQKDSLEFAATDSHKLAVVNAAISENPNEILDEEQEGTEAEIIVPHASCEEILHQLLSKKSQRLAAIEIKVSETACSFEWKNKLGECFIFTRLIAGQYPDYPKLIDPSYSNIWSIDGKQLLDACERVSLFSLRKNPVIVISVEGGFATISANSNERGSGSEKIQISVIEGGKSSIEIGFNAQYLTELLKVINSSSSTDKILIKSNHPLRPVIVEPETLGGITFLIMPVQLRHLQAVA